MMNIRGTVQLINNQRKWCQKHRMIGGEVGWWHWTFFLVGLALVERVGHGTEIHNQEKANGHVRKLDPN